MAKIITWLDADGRDAGRQTPEGIRAMNAVNDEINDLRLDDRIRILIPEDARSLLIEELPG